MRHKEPTPIQRATADYFKISIVELQMGGQKTKNVVNARHVARYIERQRGLTLTEIGELYNCDHTTVIASVNHVKERLAAADERYVESVPVISDIVRSSITSDMEAVIKARNAIKDMTCPTCGAPFLLELQRQISVLSQRVTELQHQNEGAPAPKLKATL